MEPYVTVDLDNPQLGRIVKSWKRVSVLCDITGSGGPYGRVSSSGTGVHIRTHWYRPHEVEVRSVLRRMCLDDKNRIAGDMENEIETNQVLYDSKGATAHCGPWVRSLGDLIYQYTDLENNL